MATDQKPDFPAGAPDERELLLRWLGFLRGAVIRKIEGLSEDEARWRPNGRLISLLGIVNHLTHVEWRWIDGGMRGEPRRCHAGTPRRHRWRVTHAGYGISVRSLCLMQSTSWS